MNELLIKNRPSMFKITLEQGDRKDKASLKYDAVFVNAKDADEALTIFKDNWVSMSISEDFRIVRVEEVPFDAYMIIQAD